MSFKSKTTIVRDVESIRSPLLAFIKTVSVTLGGSTSASYVVLHVTTPVVALIVKYEAPTAEEGAKLNFALGSLHVNSTAPNSVFAVLVSVTRSRVGEGKEHCADAVVAGEFGNNVNK